MLGRHVDNFVAAHPLVIQTNGARIDEPGPRVASSNDGVG